jgi:CCR4-NOT transcriptional regulation complex NOT5 subunit
MANVNGNAVMDLFDRIYNRIEMGEISDETVEAFRSEILALNSRGYDIDLSEYDKIAEQMDVEAASEFIGPWWN